MSTDAVAEEAPFEVDGVPTWLETPVNDVPLTSPPVQSRPQVLPLQELSWEHFERLCLRYVRTRASVVMTQLYGIPGQKQHGIDFYVRLAEPSRFEVYQCKRLATFEAKDVTKAVSEFLRGKWRTNAKAFRIMTSHAIENSSIADAIVAAQNKLGLEGIDFEVWGKEQISIWLKDQPRLVDDFFSRGWVEAFCGPESLVVVGKRLNAETVAAYRVHLRRFYEVLFNQFDPGIPVRAVIGDRALTLRERFILPDLFGNLTNDKRPLQATEPPPFSSEATDGKDHKVSPSSPVHGLRSRFEADKWISQSQRSVVLGGPGSGKSALLRMLAVELLSEEPSFPQTASKWATLLPVWIPFSFWTTLNARRETPASVSECLSTWFKQFDQIQIWPLVEAALEDERLLLLVDSLDEWTDETAARTTSTILQTFIQTRNLPAVLVSRPHGFERVSVQGPDWQVGYLAPLSGEQQRQLVTKWLRIHRDRAVGTSTGQAIPDLTTVGHGDKETEDFLRKLGKASDLFQLADVPLTLLLLLYLHLQNMPLPSNRFDAYEHVVKHFIHEHPLSRRTAASSTSDSNSLTHEEIRHALAFIAFLVQTNYPSGILTAEDIKDSLEGFLRDDAQYGLGLSRQEALEVLKSFTNVEEGSLGLLVSQGQAQISFFHRSLQEYLAALHISRTPLANQVEIIQANLADPRWREVIVGLVFLCQRGEDASILVDGIESAHPDSIGRLLREDILAEVAFKNSNLPPARVKSLVSQSFNIVETSFVAFHRSRILAHVMAGLYQRKNRSLIQSRLKRWTFSRGLWGPGRIEGLSSWPAEDQTMEVLFRELHDEDGAVVRQAAGVLAQLFGGSQKCGDALAGLALRSTSPYQRAASIEALTKGWPDHALLDAVLASGGKSRSDDVRLATILSRVHLKRQTDEDLATLLDFARHRASSLLQYAWQEEVATTLAAGWEGDPRLKAECLKASSRHYYQVELMNQETAQYVLIKAFPQDDEVADVIVKELKEQYAFNSARRGVWSLLPRSFRDHPKVVAALDEWAYAEEYRDVIALHYGSLVGRTPVLKKRLFQAMEEHNPFWAVGSLLDGWGMADYEVSAKLRERVLRDDAAEFAQYIPAILGDSDSARRRLLELLRDAKSHRIDFLMHGFVRLEDKGDAEEIVQAALERFAKKRVEINYAGSLILAFPHHPRVKALAKENLRSQSPSFGAIVEMAAHDSSLREEVSEFITPLPADLRYQIVSDLTVFADEAFAVELLSGWDAERNSEVKKQASVQFHSITKQSASQSVAATEVLESMLPCYGPDHEERRQAAGAGLIVLKQLNVIVGKSESLGHTGKQVNIAVSDGFRQNRVFLDILGKNWAYVKGVIGEHWEILTDRLGADELWERLAAVATEYPELAKDILEKSDSDGALRRSSKVLTLFSRIEPKSERLATACISVLASQEQWHHWYDSVETASEILAEQFRGNPEIEKRIIAIASERHVPTSVIMALALGWRSSDLLKEIEFDLNPADVRASELYTKYAVAKADRIPSIIEADLVWARLNKYQTTMLVKPLIARLRFDPLVAEYCFAHVKLASNPDVKVSFPRILAAAGEMTAERAAWCREELERQQAIESPEFGFDVLAQTPRSLHLCLLESLGETTSFASQLTPDS